jgi:hypothetical protein
VSSCDRLGRSRGCPTSRSRSYPGTKGIAWRLSVTERGFDGERDGMRCMLGVTDQAVNIHTNQDLVRFNRLIGTHGCQHDAVPTILDTAHQPHISCNDAGGSSKGICRRPETKVLHMPQFVVRLPEYSRAAAETAGGLIYTQGGCEPVSPQYTQN